MAMVDMGMGAGAAHVMAPMVADAVTVATCGAGALEDKVGGGWRGGKLMVWVGQQMKGLWCCSQGRPRMRGTERFVTLKLIGDWWGGSVRLD